MEGTTTTREKESNKEEELMPPPQQSSSGRDEPCHSPKKHQQEYCYKHMAPTWTDHMFPNELATRLFGPSTSVESPKDHRRHQGLCPL